MYLFSSLFIYLSALLMTLFYIVGVAWVSFTQLKEPQIAISTTSEQSTTITYISPLSLEKERSIHFSVVSENSPSLSLPFYLFFTTDRPKEIEPTWEPPKIYESPLLTSQSGRAPPVLLQS